MASMINLRVILVLIFVFASFGNAVPVSVLRLEHREADDATTLTHDSLDTTSITPTTLATEDFYDQRQNGTENYRIHVDGLVVVVAPIEALLLAAGGPNGLGNNFLTDLSSAGAAKPESKPQEAKPTLAAPAVEEKPSDNLQPSKIQKKAAHRSHLRIVSLLGPLLKRVGVH